MFVTDDTPSVKQKTIHEELAHHLKATLRPVQADQLVIARFLSNSWFFFEVLIKSMAQHLLSTGRIKVIATSQQAQNICITFILCWTNVENIGATLYKCYTTVLCLLGLGQEIYSVEVFYCHFRCAW